MDILNGYLTREELAAQLGVKPSTLDRWARLRRGPRYIRKSKQRLYHREDAKEWLRAGGLQPYRSRTSRKSLARNSLTDVGRSP
jgi:hypothetical protein